MADSDDDRLEELRALQDGAPQRGPGSFGEWSREQDLRKTGRALTGPGYAPGVGMMGPPGNTASRAPHSRSMRSGEQGVGFGGNHGPGQRDRNEQQRYSTEPWFGNSRSMNQFGVPASAPAPWPSRYAFERLDQPPPWIDDVDMQNIWYSPFEPVWPFGPPYYTRPREWNYPVGYNLNYIPQQVEVQGMLRGMRQSWGVLAAIIETRKDQLLRLPWTIQRKDRPRATSKRVDDLRKFFRRPDGILSYSQWTRKLLDDLFVIDAPTIYLNRSVGGQLLGAEVHDGGMYFPLIDDAGRRPATFLNMTAEGIDYIHRQPAFQEVVYGLPMIDVSADELIYAPMHIRPELPVFGFSPVQQILVEATEAIRKTFYQLEFWRSGSMPELIITVPDQWTPRQIASFQGHFDALLSGQLSLKSKVRFVPGGMKPFDIKNASGESLWSQRDELLVRLACYAFSVSPTPFVRQMNRGTAQNAQQQAQEEGLYPLMSWWKDDIIDTLIQEKFGFDDCEFVFLPRPEVDQEKQSKIHQVQVDEGLRNRNEIRAELGEEPIEGGDVYTVKTSTGVVPLEMVVSGEAAAAAQGGASEGGAKKPPVAEAKPGDSAKPEGAPMRGSPRPIAASPQPASPVHKLYEACAERWFAKATAAELDAAARNAKGHLDDYSHQQLHAGNYPKGHIWIQGLNVSIENNTGSKRGEKDQSGTKWEVTMESPYGYIRGTVGADGDSVDCYLGQHPESPTVWVIDQNRVSKKGKIKGFDEHKVMLGYEDLKTALHDYLSSHFDGHGHERIDKVTELSMKEFKTWLQNGDLKEPIADQKTGGDVVLKQKDVKDFAKLGDTISTATNLSSYSYLTTQRKRKRRKKLRSGPRWLQLAV